MKWILLSGNHGSQGMVEDVESFVKFNKEYLLVFSGALLVLIVPSVCALLTVGVGMSVNNIELQDLDKGEDPPPIVTLAEFERVEKDMSHQQVAGIIGDPGIILAPPTAAEHDEIGFVETSIHVWQNSDASNMRATFQNGRLVKKSQLYLK